MGFETKNLERELKLRALFRDVNNSDLSGLFWFLQESCLWSKRRSIKILVRQEWTCQ